jgi:3-methyladenine DNA glycosylase/8-oxoguanine DNA glycosylase
MEKRGARWQPYRSVASWYLWRAADIATQQERARKAPSQPAAKRSAARLRA